MPIDCQAIDELIFAASRMAAMASAGRSARADGVASRAVAGRHTLMPMTVAVTARTSAHHIIESASISRFIPASAIPAPFIGSGYRRRFGMRFVVALFRQAYADTMFALHLALEATSPTPGALSMSLAADC